jgi:uncharacterized protein (DUF1800 family)
MMFRYSTNHIAAMRSLGGASVATEQERISHVVRRLSMGANAADVAASASTDDAIARTLDLSSPPAQLPVFESPADFEAANSPQDLRETMFFWLQQMVLSPRRVEERLVWFWHDHFATSIRKVKIPYLMWQQHATVRRHATGRFDELLRAIAIDPAMLNYLDGRTNRVGAINENFAREVMELHTMGHGTYTQEDVVAAARSFSGWVMAPGGAERRRPPGSEPWTAAFIPNRHDNGDKTFLGVTGNHDLEAVIDILLDQPATATTVAGKLFEELVGLRADDATRERLGSIFRAEWKIMSVVEEIVADPAFTSDEAIRSRVRTPVERLVGVVQGIETTTEAPGLAAGILESSGYVPFLPPNPAGFAGGARLLGPYQLAHSLDISGIVARPAPDYDVDQLFSRLGLFDVSATTRQVVASAPDPLSRITLAAASPEYALT